MIPSHAHPELSDPLDPTALVLDWLAENPDSITEARSKGALAERIAAYTRAESADGATVTAAEFEELRSYLEKRVSSDNDLAALRRDFAKYAAIHAPREVAEMPAMVAWALTRIDWHAVAAFVAHQAAAAD